MKKLKIWICTKFLPVWCKEELLEENKQLARMVSEQRQEIDRLCAYIDGMNNAMHRQPRIHIREVKRE